MQGIGRDLGQDLLLPGVEHVPKYVEEKGMETTMLSMPNISCQHCIMTIKRESGEALTALKATLAEAGYPVAGS